MVNFLIASEDLIPDRLDAEFYKFQSDILTRRLNEYHWVEDITNLTEKITHLPGFLRDEFLIYVERGVPYLRQGNLSFYEGVDLSSDVVYIPKTVHEAFEVSKVKKNDVLLTVTGAYYGLAVPILNYSSELNACPDVVIIRLNNESVSPAYLATFLNSKYGQIQLRKWNSGLSRPRILTQNVRKIKIPVPDSLHKKEVDNLIHQAYLEVIEAGEIYQEAENELLKILGFDISELATASAQKTFSIDSTEIQTSLRFDPSFHHIKFKLIDRRLDDIGGIDFQERIPISKERINPQKGKLHDEIFKYIPISKLTKKGIITEWDEVIGWRAPSRAALLVHTGNVLIPTLKGTFEKISLVPEYLDGQVTTTGIIVAESKYYSPEVLFLLLRTRIYRDQLEKLTTGGIMSAVSQSDLDNIRVPSLDSEDQFRLANMVKRYFSLLYHSRTLVDDAIKSVENHIEGQVSDNTTE